MVKPPIHLETQRIRANYLTKRFNKKKRCERGSKGKTQTQIKRSESTHRVIANISK